MADVSTIGIELLRAGSAFAMIFGGVFPYIPQYQTIKRTSSSEGFSLFVCFTLLLANILRILFWFGKRFELPLLLQSILMIATMIVLVHASVNAASTKHKFVDSPRRFRDMQVDQFWNWSDFQSYMECIVLLTIVLSSATFVLTGISPVYNEIVGFLSVFIEACLGMPQFYRNFQKRSTAGMSIAMVTMWTCGDTFKTAYFHYRDAPKQFFICGILQILVDVAILLQIAAYGRHAASGASSSSTSRGGSPWASHERQPSKNQV